MSLLFYGVNEKLIGFARKAYDRLIETYPGIYAAYDESRKMPMYEGILQSLRALFAAIEFDEDRIFMEHAAWSYRLICNTMKDMEGERVREQMVMYYQILMDVLKEALPENEALKAEHHLRNAMETTERESVESTESNRFSTGGYLDIRRDYLDRLMMHDTQGALSVIEKAFGAGTDLGHIYIDVIQEAMAEVGELWHRNAISVEKEHYCSTTTQFILSRFYPVIFNTPRNGYRMLSCCIGNELHEMGIRMVSDLFEYHGWDSTYLGNVVHSDMILNAISEVQPDLVALSVTMPYNLSPCHEIIQAVRKRHGGLRIAVGGRAFQMTDPLWKKWGVDISLENADQLVEWAEREIINSGRIIHG